MIGFWRMEERESPVLSTSTILILSGILIGLALAQPLEDFTFYLLSCGMAGLLAYLVFDVKALHRAQSQAQQEQRQMESRLDRHVACMTPLSEDALAERARLVEWLQRETETLAR
jgi:flagellar biosynthesis component FlhA